ncbi:unnamed protein product [Acanthoscelides obtectus]|uniref:NLGase n=1 Tax=Acanthoscelides obtectus TaxID=200917 RepID=A0A9P0LPG6_ACAOB|nr:unnamed protein product [Acanthoscelides obtectus]CAK1643149.1 Non-lysosomal glucosylceramidase [Acanthoscelides obtectus]
MGDYILQKTKITSVPKYGLKVKLNHVYPEKRTQNFVPSLKIIWSMLPLILRYLWDYVISKIRGTYVVMDYVYVENAKQIYGVPVGGIGSGTIGRGYRGEFCRFQMRPGIYEWNTVDANQFIITIKDQHQETIFHSLLTTFPKKSLKSWQSLIDGSKCNYTGLYPRSWTEYDLTEYGIKLKCRQISPVIPHDYVNSCLPCAVFVWSIENVSDEQRTVTVSLTFKNGTGNKKDRNATCSSKIFSYINSEGVILYHTIDNMRCTYALAVKSEEGVKVSKCLYFDPKSDGMKPWIQLKNNGEFEKVSGSSHGHVYGEMACGIAAKTTLPPSTSKQIDMSLVWDMPTITFPGKRKNYHRFYTRKFGLDNAVLKIVSHAFDQYVQWEESIYEWQKDVLENSEYPDWYKSALFNQSYFISDGGGVWLTLDEEESMKLGPNDPRLAYGRFAYLEGHEYVMYNSYDVHFYASHALFKNWPYLQKCMQYDLRDFISLEVPQKVKMMYDGRVVERKYPSTVPHDAGTPGEEPFILPNSYPIHDVSCWKDLSSKFVLQTYRDAFASGNPDNDYIADMYDACYTVMHKSLQTAVDDDGLIVNGGTPDQTYDTWIMTGVSAYCGGLWLAALYTMIALADRLRKSEDKATFEKVFASARKSYDQKLWNGICYNFDSSSKESTAIMADQLCGHWYLRCCGINDYDVFPKDKVRKTLRTIYENNVLSFCNGTMGAVNGFLNGAADTVSLQSQEVWTGVTYALAATMLFEDMYDEGLKTAGGMYRSMSELFGLEFDIPEALYAKKFYRAIGYMRPLSIWSMQIALEGKKNQETKAEG